MRKHKRHLLLIVLFLVIFGPNVFCEEKLYMKSGDVYSCNFVLRNNDKVVVLLFGYRVEIPAGDLKRLSFEGTDDELEIVLNDNTVIKGQIVEQDDEFYTIGTSAGLNTIEKAKIKEIRNPEHAQFYEARAADAISFQMGIVPSYATILNSFGASYNTFWGAELYIEMGLFRNFRIGLDLDFLMLLPQFGSTNETLFLLPVMIAFKYENSLGDPGNAENPLSRLFWYIKGGAGASFDVFMEQSEGRTTFAIAVCMAVSYGLRYRLMESFSIGVGGKTQVIMEPSAYVLAQTAGIILELKF